VVVVSTAIVRTNPEVEAAYDRRVPVVRRAEMLAELMRLKSTVAVAGTHGKTTTTSMVAALLDAGGVDPTVINGGIINSYGSNARLGDSDWMVVEADESDGSFLRLDGTIAVVTNIDPEHLDHYGSFDRVKDAFVEFVENVPFYGAACCASIIPRCRRSSRASATAASSPMAFAASADVRGVNVTPIRRQPLRGDHPPARRHDALDREYRAADAGPPQCPERARRDRRGAGAGHPRRDDPARASPVRRGQAPLHQGRRDGTASRHRRLRPSSGRDPRGAVGGARERAGRVIAVVQPHRYTRLGNLMDDFAQAFNDADMVYVAPVYAAGEQPIEGVNAEALVEGIRAAGIARRRRSPMRMRWPGPRRSATVTIHGRVPRATSPNGPRVCPRDRGARRHERLTIEMQREMLRAQKARWMRRRRCSTRAS
jgi:UDP-N-acetylmuramate--alanine ligase